MELEKTNTRWFSPTGFAYIEQTNISGSNIANYKYQLRQNTDCGREQNNEAYQKIHNNLEEATKALEELEQPQKSFEELHKEIMENYNFKKVHRAMRELNWTWAYTHGAGVPTIEKLKETATKLLQYAYHKKCGTATGGFRATYFNNELSLSFVVASWGAE